MARQVSCPECQTAHTIPEGRSGRLKCKGCATTFAVEAEPAARKPPPPPLPGTRPAPPPLPAPRRGRRAAEREARSPVALIAGLIGASVLVAAGLAATVFYLLPDSKPKAAAQVKVKPAETPRARPTPADKPEPPKPEEPPPPREDGPPPRPTRPTPPGDPPLYAAKADPKSPVSYNLESAAHQLAVLADGKTAVVATNHMPGLGKAQLRLVDLPSGRVTKPIPTDDVEFQTMAASADGSVVALSGSAMGVHLYSTPSGEKAGKLEGTAAALAYLAVSRDGSLVARAEWNLGGARGIIRVVDRKSGDVRFSVEKAHLNVFKGLALTPDNKYVVSTGVDRGNEGSKVIVWEVATGKRKHVLEGYPGTAEGLAVSSDGKLIAAAINAGFGGGSLRVWDVETGAERLAVLGKVHGAYLVTFGPEDKTVLGAWYDSRVRVFDVRKGTDLGGFRTTSIPATLVALSPDGKRLVAAYFKEVKVFDFPDDLEDLSRRPGEFRFAGAAVVEGKPVEWERPGAPPPAAAVPGAGTVVDGTVESSKGDTVRLRAGNRTTSVLLLDDSKVLDAAGKEVAGDAAKAVRRVGNVVRVKIREEAFQPVAEMRLVKEGPAERTVEKAKLLTADAAGAGFWTSGVELWVKLTPDARYVDADGKPAAEPKAFLQEGGTYSLRLELKAGQELPLLAEARLVAKAVVRPAIELPNAKRFEGATVTLVRDPESTRFFMHLVTPDGKSVRYASHAKTKATDQAGREMPYTEVLKEGNVVSGVTVPLLDGGVMVEEVRLVKVGEPKPPRDPLDDPDAKTAKGVTVVRGPAGRKGAEGLQLADKRPLPFVRASGTKAFDAEGKSITVTAALREGNKLDVVYVPFNESNRLLKLQVVEAGPAVTTEYKGVTVKTATPSKVYVLRSGTKSLAVRANDQTKVTDAEGKPARPEDVLKVGSSVDVLVEEQPRISVLLEARPAK